MEQFDVAIVGAGPTGLACGIELKGAEFRTCYSTRAAS